MNIDEMKNKISMELKNSITQQGFEIICKQLTEKDRQIEELEGQVTRAFEVLEGKRKRIEELEAQTEKMKSCRSCRYDNNCTHRVCGKELENWQLKE